MKNKDRLYDRLPLSPDSKKELQHEYFMFALVAAGVFALDRFLPVFYRFIINLFH